MTRRAVLTGLASLLAAWLALSTPAGAGESPGPPWRFEGWKYRVLFSLAGLDGETKRELQKGLAYAALDVRTGGRERKDAADVRVADEKGELLRCWVGEADEFGVRRIYCRPGKSGRVEVYFGNPEADEAPPRMMKGGPLYTSLHGLELTVYPCSNRMRPLESAERIEQIVANLKKAASARLERAHLVSSIKAVKAATGFFAQAPFIAVFRGYILAPWDGEYFFGTDSQGPSFILIDGKEVAAWPGAHWKHGSFVNGGKIRLKRGSHRFTYVSHRLVGRPIFASAGWRPPGWPDSFEIPKEYFVRYVPLEPVSASSADGSPLPAPQVVRHEDVSLNGGPPMAHLEFRALPSLPDPAWALEGAAEGDFPLEIGGRSCHLFLKRNVEWTLALLSGGKPVERFPLALPKSRTVLKVWARAELDGLPPAVYRGEPFGLLLNVPFTSPFAFPVDFRASRISGGTPACSRTLRRFAAPDAHTVADVTVDPCRPETFALPGMPFSGERSAPAPDFYSSRFLFECFAAGYKVSEHAFRFLSASDPLPDDLECGRDGLLRAGGDRVVLVSEIEDAAAFRRWALLKKLAEMGERPERFLVAGDTLESSGAGLAGFLAEALNRKGKRAYAAPSLPDAPFVTALPALLSRLESGEIDCLVLAAGFSDAFLRTPLRELEAVLHAVVDRARAKGVEKIVLCPPPVSPGAERMTRPCRTMLFDLARRLRLDTADLDPLLSGAFRSAGCWTRHPAADALREAARALAADLLR